MEENMIYYLCFRLVTIFMVSVVLGVTSYNIAYLHYGYPLKAGSNDIVVTPLK